MQGMMPLDEHSISNIIFEFCILFWPSFFRLRDGENEEERRVVSFFSSEVQRREVPVCMVH